MRVDEKSIESETKWNLILEALKFNKKATNVTFPSIGPKFVSQLSEFLKTNLSVKKLFLSYLKAGEEGMKFLSEALRVNSSLEEIDLSHNNIKNELMKHLSEALKVNSSLKILNLSSNNFGDEGTQFLSESLKVNSTLKTINLRYHSFTAESMKFFSEALKVNSSLEDIDLSDSDITDESMNILSESLKFNSSLTTINLSSNYLTEEAMKNLSEALKVNSSLKNINLSSNNKIGDEGIKNLAEAFKVNTSLKLIQLSDLNIEASAMKSLTESLQKISPPQIFECQNLKKKNYELFSEFSKITSLKKIVLFINKIKTNYEEELTKLTFSHEEINFELEKLHFIDAFGRLVNVLKENSSIKEIGLEGISTELVDKFSHCISDLFKNGSLKKVIVDPHYPLDFDSSKLTVLALKNNFTMKEFVFKRKENDYQHYMIDFFLSCNRKWKPQYHASFHPYFKSLILTLILCLKRVNITIPKTLMCIIFRYLDRRSFLSIVDSSPYTDKLQNKN